MIYLSQEMQKGLKQVFFESNISLEIKSDHMVVEDAQDQTEEKIRQIISAAGFCPLISRNKSEGKLAFTIVPFKVPNFFYAKNNSSQTSLEIHKALEILKPDSCYFTMKEISSLLESAKYTVNHDSGHPKDKWSKINFFRRFVSSALNTGLDEIISKKSPDGHPIVEIGSGIGYEIPKNLSSRTIRIQPAPSECQLLKNTISEPVYKLDIEGMYNCLIGSSKKVPLFFALNVFDIMSPSERKSSITQISKLQNSGDHILIMLDTNPCLDVIIEQLENLYPDHAIFPFLPLSIECAKFSVVLVPLKYAPFKLLPGEILEMIKQDTMTIMNGYVPPVQIKLHQLQEKYDFKVICLEDYFIEHIKKDLEENGYKTNVYYHASFTTGEPPKDVFDLNQDLIYKCVTDTSTVRQWSLRDDNLLKSLNNKGIKLPAAFNEAFLSNLKEQGKKIFGAEILVIECTKT